MNERQLKYLIFIQAKTTTLFMTGYGLNMDNTELFTVLSLM